jgi:hypothetical protein
MKANLLQVLVQVQDYRAKTGRHILATIRSR